MTKRKAGGIDISQAKRVVLVSRPAKAGIKNREL
jgi:hypothetical protein